MKDQKYILYFDDTGSRDPDHISIRDVPRSDGMDCFGLGGILIKENDISTIIQKHKEFCREWSIDYPLHSSSIRGGHGKFGWLKKPENAGLFFPSLQKFILTLPIIGIACVIHRPGYVKRYKEPYSEKLWYMCKTAFCVLIERAAKFSDSQNCQLEVFFEETGKKEDRDIINYMRSLKQNGNPFSMDKSKLYNPFTSDDYKRIVLGEPRRKTKKVPMIQLADLVLYPIAKGGYDPTYPPYKELLKEKKLIDCYLDEKEISSKGIKYSCFEDVKKKGST